MAEFAIFQITLLKKCSLVLNCNLKCQCVKWRFCRWAITCVLAEDSPAIVSLGAHMCSDNLSCPGTAVGLQQWSFLEFLYAKSCKSGRKLMWFCSFFPLLTEVRKSLSSCPKEVLVKLKDSIWFLCQSAVQGCSQGMVVWVYLGWEIEGEETAVMRADLAPVRSAASSAWVLKSPRTVSLVWTPSSCQTASLSFS